jgi:uncharacterized membrane protein YozB (DUF420 family)
LDDFVKLAPHLNASLNALATVLLVLGYAFIRRRQEVAHKWTMLACFAVSVVFLGSYLTYHYHLEGVSKKFPAYPPAAARTAYYAILISHVVLAAVVPFLATATIYSGLAEKRDLHRRLAKLTFPIWLYVSVTGVVVYWMLYQLYPAVTP